MNRDKSILVFLISIILLLYVLWDRGIITNIKNREFFRDKRIREYDSQDFTAYRNRIAEEIKRKELNRDFNFEVPLFYKTPFQYLDFQDLLINEYDNVYNATPEEIEANLLEYR
jgi:hypothetical protein